MESVQTKQPQRVFGLFNQLLAIVIGVTEVGLAITLFEATKDDPVTFEDVVDSLLGFESPILDVGASVLTIAFVVFLIMTPVRWYQYGGRLRRGE